jgi:beta-glucanase (GH16 family)
MPRLAILAAIAAVSVTSAAFAADTDTPNKDWKLVFEQDFSKQKEIDKKVWNLIDKGDGFGNNELQYYTPRADNVKIENGELVITQKKENYKGRQYTSAKLTTEGKFSIKYGRIEACIKSPKAQKGSWPAFWMMPQDNKYGGWPKSGEIDIMEMVNKSDELFGTLHYGGNGHQQGGAKIKAPAGTNFPQDYHVYAVEWEEKEFRWYLDGKYYGNKTQWSTSAAFPAPFDQRFYIILNFACGGQWPGNPDGNSTWPQEMRVKYVRAYASPKSVVTNGK